MAIFDVQHVYNIPLKGPILLGKVDGGAIKIGMVAHLQDKTLTVKQLSLGFESSVAARKARLPEVRGGDVAAMNVELSGQLQDKEKFLADVFWRT